MRTTIRLLVCAAALAVPAVGLLVAQETAPTSPGGRVLILDNERVLEGEVVRDGERVTVRRQHGEITVPAARVLAVCGTLEEAYQFLATRANLRDADERLRLARWCQGCGLRDQAIAEARAAVQLRPGSSEAKQLLLTLQRPPAPAPEPAPDHVAAAVENIPLLEVSADCLAVFANKVQPILMNTCASCHAAGRGGSFVLTRSNDAAGRRATQINLSSTLRQVCFEQPASSPLLFKACVAHGGALQPPLASHQAVPLGTMQSWVEMVAARNPHLRPHGVALAAVTPAKAAPTQPPQVPQQVGFSTAVTQEALAKAATAAPQPRAVESYPGLAKAGTPDVPAAQESPAVPRTLPPLEAAPVEPTADEYDPGPFNRQAVPQPAPQAAMQPKQ
jgi:hypothetical protein